MNQIVNQLHTLEELDQTLEESKNRPVLLFKHSNACPISSRAYREFQAYLDHADPDVGHYLVIVQAARPVSDEIESRLNLQHESPQAILVKDGREIWNASHYEITASALAKTVTNHKG